jgi:ribonuclease HII
MEQALYSHDRSWTALGYTCIAGTDEAGRGPLAGPVVAAAVILSLDAEIPMLNDSKKLSVIRREKAFQQIMDSSVVSWEIIDAVTIDEINIYQAARLAMTRAVLKLGNHVDLILTDAMPLPDIFVKCVPLVRGDALSASIAAASVIAKVTRDRMMDNYDQLYPEYGFKTHKGYGTKQHMDAIAKHGPCPIHRQTFEPIKSWRASLHEN